MIISRQTIEIAIFYIFNSWSRLIHKPSFFPKAGNSSLPLKKKKKQSHLEVSIHDKYFVNWNPLLSLFFLSGICLSLLSKTANGFRWKLTYLYSGGEGGLLSKLMGTELPPLLLVPGHLLLGSADMWSHPLLDSVLTPIAGICGPCLRLPVEVSTPRLHGPHQSLQTSAVRLVLCELPVTAAHRADVILDTILLCHIGRDRKRRSRQGVLGFSPNLFGVSVSVSHMLPMPLCKDPGNIFTWMHLLKIFLKSCHTRRAFLNVSYVAYYLQ